MYVGFSEEDCSLLRIQYGYIIVNAGNRVIIQRIKMDSSTMLENAVKEIGCSEDTCGRGYVISNIKI